MPSPSKSCSPSSTISSVSKSLIKENVHNKNTTQTLCLALLERHFDKLIGHLCRTPHGKYVLHSLFSFALTGTCDLTPNCSKEEENIHSSPFFSSDKQNHFFCTTDNFIGVHTPKYLQLSEEKEQKFVPRLLNSKEHEINEGASIAGEKACTPPLSSLLSRSSDLETTASGNSSANASQISLPHCSEYLGGGSTTPPEGRPVPPNSCTSSDHLQPLNLSGKEEEGGGGGWPSSRSLSVEENKKLHDLREEEKNVKWPLLEYLFVHHGAEILPHLCSSGGRGMQLLTQVILAGLRNADVHTVVNFTNFFQHVMLQPLIEEAQEWTGDTTVDKSPPKSASHREEEEENTEKKNDGNEENTKDRSNEIQHSNNNTCNTNVNVSYKKSLFLKKTTSLNDVYVHPTTTPLTNEKKNAGSPSSIKSDKKCVSGKTASSFSHFVKNEDNIVTGNKRSGLSVAVFKKCIIWSLQYAHQDADEMPHSAKDTERTEHCKEKKENLMEEKKKQEEGKEKVEEEEQTKKEEGKEEELGRKEEYKEKEKSVEKTRRQMLEDLCAAVVEAAPPVLTQILKIELFKTLKMSK